MLLLCGPYVYGNWLFHVSICCLSALNSPFIACYAKMDTGPLKMFPLPTSGMLNFVNRRHWRDTAEGRVLMCSLSRLLKGTRLPWCPETILQSASSSPDLSACSASLVCVSQRDPLASNFSCIPLKLWLVYMFLCTAFLSTLENRFLATSKRHTTNTTVTSLLSRELHYTLSTRSGSQLWG